MTGEAFVCKLKNHIPIPGADRIVQVNMYGETIITQKNTKEGELGLLFDIETKLHKEFASALNLYVNSALNNNQLKKGYLLDDGRVRPIKLKEVKCSALFIPVSALIEAGLITSTFELEPEKFITKLNDITICSKYETSNTHKNKFKNFSGSFDKDSILVLNFKMNINTPHLLKNLSSITPGSRYYITEKLHGTSLRVGRLKKLKKVKSPFTRILNFLNLYFNEKFNFELSLKGSKYLYLYSLVVGSRRRILKTKFNLGKPNLWVDAAYYFFKHLNNENIDNTDNSILRKGETVYAEIVGYHESGKSIMPTAHIDKLSNFLSERKFKDFARKYGNTMVFGYGQNYVKDPYKIYVYRITQTNEDGHVIELTHDQLVSRCQELGVNPVPLIETGMVYQKDDGTLFLRSESRIGSKIESTVDKLSQGPSALSDKHIKEGVVMRVESIDDTRFFKHKSYEFKVLEGLIKDENSVDIEESN